MRCCKGPEDQRESLRSIPQHLCSRVFCKLLSYVFRMGRLLFQSFRNFRRYFRRRNSTEPIQVRSFFYLIVYSYILIDAEWNNKHFRESHWISESGEVDLFLLPGPTPADIYTQYTKLTGKYLRSLLLGS